jgi:hypothetical protein
LFKSYASTEIVDEDGHIVPVDELQKTIDKWHARGASISDGDHSDKIIGKGTGNKYGEDWGIGTHPVAKVPALWIKGQVFHNQAYDDEVWSQTKKGERTGLSWSGRFHSYKNVSIKGTPAKELHDLETYAFALCGDPKNQYANMMNVNFKASSGDAKKAMDEQKGRDYTSARGLWRQMLQVERKELMNDCELPEYLKAKDWEDLSSDRQQEIFEKLNYIHGIKKKTSNDVQKASFDVEVLVYFDDDPNAPPSTVRVEADNEEQAKRRALEMIQRKYKNAAKVEGVFQVKSVQAYGLKSEQSDVDKEKKEHPWATEQVAERIVEDHENKAADTAGKGENSMADPIAGQEGKEVVTMEAIAALLKQVLERLPAAAPAAGPVQTKSGEGENVKLPQTPSEKTMQENPSKTASADAPLNEATVKAIGETVAKALDVAFETKFAAKSATPRPEAGAAKDPATNLAGGQPVQKSFGRAYDVATGKVKLSPSKLMQDEREVRDKQRETALNAIRNQGKAE